MSNEILSSHAVTMRDFNSSFNKGIWESVAQSINQIGYIPLILLIIASVLLVQSFLWAYFRIVVFFIRKTINLIFGDYDSIKSEFIDDIQEPRNLSRMRVIILNTLSNILVFLSGLTIVYKIINSLTTDQLSNVAGLVSNKTLSQAYNIADVLCSPVVQIFTFSAQIWYMVWLTRKGFFVLAHFTNMLSFISYIIFYYMMLGQYYGFYLVTASDSFEYGSIKAGIGFLYGILLLILILFNARFVHRTKNLKRFHINLFLITAVLPLGFILPIVYTFGLIDFVGLILSIAGVLIQTTILYYFRYIKDHNSVSHPALESKSLESK